MTLRLYDIAISGNCHKVRLFLSYLDRPHQLIPVHHAEGELASAEFGRLNPLRQVPVLEDGPLRLRDSHAILIYLAGRYGPDWSDHDTKGFAEIAQWLFFAASEVATGPQRARFQARSGNVAADTRAQSLKVLRVVEEHLSGQNWLAAERATIADVAVFPYLALSHQAGLPLEDHPALCRWIDRMTRLPGYLSMPGLPPASNLCRGGSR